MPPTRTKHASLYITFVEVVFIFSGIEYSKADLFVFSLQYNLEVVAFFELFEETGLRVIGLEDDVFGDLVT